MRSQQSVHMARMWCEAGDSAVLGGLVQWCGARAWRAFAEIAGRVWRQDDGADELSVTGNFKESVETVMKGTICFWNRTGENNAKFTENCVITLAKVSDFCYNVYRVGIGFDLNFHKKPYYITIL